MLGKTGYLILITFVVLIIIPVILINGLFWSTEKEELLIDVYNHKQDKIVTMELDDYLRGVVAAEMPALYHIEALKAQAVAARTYTIKQLPQFGGAGSQSHPGADISTDYRDSQAWLAESDMKEKWGFVAFFYYWARINRAVEETSGEIILYDNKPIDAVYHANSGGITEEAVNVWGNSVPYLVSVKSPTDLESEKNYKHTLYFASLDIIKALGLKETSISQFQLLKKSASGRILEARIGGQILTGHEIREKLGLPSTKFEVTRNGDIFTFTVYGKGHGVGMSQDGANGLAKKGYNYRQILHHYYQGSELGTIEQLR